MAIAYTSTKDRAKVWHTDDPSYTGEDLEGVIACSEHPAPDGATVFEIRPLNAAERTRALMQSDPAAAVKAACVGIEGADDKTRDAILDGLPVNITLDLYRAVVAVTDGPFPLHGLPSS